MLDLSKSITAGGSALTMGTRSGAKASCLVPLKARQPKGDWEERMVSPKDGSKGLQGCQGCEHRSNCFLPVSPRISFPRSSCSLKLLTMISDIRGKAIMEGKVPR